MDLTSVARRVSQQVEGITCKVDTDAITFMGPAGMLRVGPAGRDDSAVGAVSFGK